METPILQPLYGGALARPFSTYHHRLDRKMYLRIADDVVRHKLIRLPDDEAQRRGLLDEGSTNSH